MKKSNLKLLAATLASISLSGALATATMAQDMPALPELEWNTSLKKFQFDSDKFIGQRFTAQCPPRSIRDKDDPIYGTDVYPSNNPICVAALHAGKITKDGGFVTVQLNPGEEAYTGSSRNEIDSADLPGTPRSLVFVDAADTTAADAVQQPYIPRLKWDAKFTRTGFAYKQLVGQRFTFNCPAAPKGKKFRRISGTDSYSFNSTVCVAALHAGKITKDGGLVHLQMDPGMDKLVGSIRHGVESKDGPGGHRTVSFVDSPLMK
ncbi:LCCL domain-containing protein [Pelagibius sp. Alg239-R121]|uniref:LCCL domain-containing protein n=1 Tax=Pelagibius sp. Alg239-R121 TaxID=2993448 RepID=UPI0024A794AA|nr:LCCL domain-containing protein [Pelagibius sp. Alg239-R121]